MGVGLIISTIVGKLGQWLKALFTLGGYFAKRRAATRAERQLDRDLILRAFDAMQANFQQGLEALSKISIASSEAQQAQANALQQWIEGFQHVATDPPTSSTMRDSDALRIWQDEQLAQISLPPEIQQLPYEKQLAWVMTTSGDPLY